MNGSYLAIGIGSLAVYLAFRQLNPTLHNMIGLMAAIFFYLGSKNYMRPKPSDSVAADLGNINKKNLLFGYLISVSLILVSFVVMFGVCFPIFERINRHGGQFATVSYVAIYIVGFVWLIFRTTKMFWVIPRK